MKQRKNLSINELLDEFCKFTDNLSNQLELNVHQLTKNEKIDIKKYTFMEIKIWKNLINTIKIEKRFKNALELNFGGQYIKIEEYINGYFMRIDRIGEAYVDFNIKFEPSSKIKSPLSSPNKFAAIVKKVSPKFADIVFEKQDKEEHKKI